MNLEGKLAYMDKAPKSLFFDFLFPTFPTGRAFYDDEQHYGWIEEKFLLVSALLDSVERKNIIKATLHLEHLNINTTKQVDEILVDAQWLREYLNKGNTLKGFFFTLSRPFRTLELKKRLYLIDSCLYKGKPCNTIESIEKIIDTYATIHYIKQGVNTWNITMDQNLELIDMYYMLKQLHIYANELLEQFKSGASVMDYLISKDLI